MKLYIDTYGHNRGMWRNAGHQARIAAHTSKGSIELVVDDNGSWAVNEGPKPGAAGGYKQVARGRYHQPDAYATFDDDPAQHDPFLRCTVCCANLCTVEEGDHLDVLSRVVADHANECQGHP